MHPETALETEILDRMVERSMGMPRAANETGRQFMLRTVRGLLADLRTPRHRILDAGRLKVGLTPAQMVWAWQAMLDEISPPEK